MSLLAWRRQQYTLSTSRFFAFRGYYSNEPSGSALVIIYLCQRPFHILAFRGTLSVRGEGRCEMTLRGTSTPFGDKLGKLLRFDVGNLVEIVLISSGYLEVFGLRRRFFGTDGSSDFKEKSVWWFQSWHFDAFPFLLLGATLTCDG